MQAFLCAVLGGTLLLAHLLRDRVARSDVRLERVGEFGPFLMQRPVEWTERYTQDGVIFEDAPQRGRPRRRLEVWTAFSPVFLSPLEFMARSDDPRLKDTVALLAGADAQALRRAATPLHLGGWNGLLLSQSRLPGAPGAKGGAAADSERLASVAAALLPSGQVLLARLEGESLDDDDAADLLRRIGRTLRLAGQVYPSSGIELALEEDITFTPPANFATFPTPRSGRRESDDMRISRMLIAQDSEHWLAADVVPCVTRPNESPDVLASLMTMRDPLFRPGALEQVDERTWLCLQADARYPAAVFHHELGDGRAVLAEFRWVATGEPARDELRVRKAWSAIAGTLGAAGTSPIPQMIDRGREIAVHLPRDPASLLGRAQPEEEWQWYHEAVSRQSTTEFDYRQDEAYLSGAWVTDHAPPLGADGGPERGGFRLARDWGSYRVVIARDNPRVLSQFSQLVRGKLRTTVTAGREVVAVRDSFIDASFIPGSVWMLALGRLPPEPTVLTTDWLINPTGGASAAPLTLVLTPRFDEAQTRPETRPAPRGHSWRVRINGRSFASEWQLDEAGRVESVTFGGNVRLRRIKPEEGEGDPAKTAQ